MRYKIAHIHPKSGRLALLCSAYIQVGSNCTAESENSKT